MNENLENKGFVLYKDSLTILDHLSDEEAGKLFKMIRAFIDGENVECDEALILVAFEPIKQSLIRNAEKYKEVSEKRSEAGRIGNLKRHYPDIYKDFEDGTLNLDDAEELAKLAKSRKFSQILANLANKDRDRDRDREKEKDILLKKETKGLTFSKPSIEEIKNYCTERKNHVSPDQFFNFYESKGWMIGKNKMKDWKASVRTWEQKNGKENPSTQNYKLTKTYDE